MNEPGLSFRKHWRQAGEGTQEDLGVTASSSPPGRCRLDGNREEEGSQQQASEGTLGTLGAVRDVKQRRHEKKGHRKLRGNTERTWKARRQAESGASSPRGGTSQMLLQDARSARRVRAFTLPR